ncbi:MAG: cytidylyltransferase domain-containing protein [Anaerovoracaceae bacterium]
MNSTRLPGKVLRLLDYRRGRSILEEIVDRLRRAEGIDEVAAATTVRAEDDAIAALCERLGLFCFRGSEEDVLARTAQTARARGMDHVLRITGDCPFIDPAVVTDLIALYRSGGYDYVSNGLRRTYPHGLDCEIFSRQVLEETDRRAENPFDREHVTSYIYAHPESFRLGSLELPDGEDCHDLRITVDTMQDYLLACVVKDLLPPDSTSFRDITALYASRPYLRLINADVMQKQRYASREAELKAAAELLRRQEMMAAAALLEAEAGGGNEAEDSLRSRS